MRKLYVAGLAVVALSLGVTSTAVAGPPIGTEPPAHPHHVHTGNGGCVDIDSVLFVPADRGLHRGSNSSGPDRGPFHGTCSEEHPHRPPPHVH